MNERDQRYQSCSIRSTQNRLGSGKLSAAFAVWKMNFSKERPFEGIRIALSIHLEAKDRISVQGTGSRRCGNVYHRK